MNKNTKTKKYNQNKKEDNNKNLEKDIENKQ